MIPRSFLLLVILGILLFAIGGIVTLQPPAGDEKPKADTTGSVFLKEASGLAIVDENHLLVHNDEQGHIYSVTLPGLQVERLVSLGNPVVLDDFEGIAIDEDRIYMITSTGKLYVTGNISFETTGQITDWRALDTGLAKICEVEGLYFDEDKLLIPCKTIYKQNGKKKSGKDRVSVYSYRPGKDTTAFALISIEDERLKGDTKRVTAIESDPDFYYLLTPAAILKIDRNTLSLELLPLDSTVHRQPEGIALMENGSVFLVDDRKNGQEGLSRYESLDAVSDF